jgi:hypothetical protein
VIGAIGADAFWLGSGAAADVFHEFVAAPMDRFSLDADEGVLKKVLPAV